MNKYKVLLPIGFGGRQEKGTIVEMDENTAKAFGSDYVIPVVDETESSESKAESKPLEKMTVAELRAKAGELELETDGSKADLLERIQLHLDSAE